jgi:hypothetical protein
MTTRATAGCCHALQHCENRPQKRAVFGSGVPRYLFWPYRFDAGVGLRGALRGFSQARARFSRQAEFSGELIEVSAVPFGESA